MNVLSFKALLSTDIAEARRIVTLHFIYGYYYPMLAPAKFNVFENGVKAGKSFSMMRMVGVPQFASLTKSG